jgi:hypothetical protein
LAKELFAHLAHFFLFIKTPRVIEHAHSQSSETIKKEHKLEGVILIYAAMQVAFPSGSAARGYLSTREL